MNTESLYLALVEKELLNCIRFGMRAEWRTLRSNKCVDNFAADAVANCVPPTCFVKHKQHDKGESDLSEEEFRCTELLDLRSKSHCGYEVTSNKLKFSRKGLNNRVLEQRSNGPLEKVLESLERKSKRHFEQ